MRLTLQRPLAISALTLALPATVLAAPPPNDVHPGITMAFSLDQAVPNVAMAQRPPLPAIVGLFLLLAAVILALGRGSRQRVASTAASATDRASVTT